MVKKVYYDFNEVVYAEASNNEVRCLDAFPPTPERIARIFAGCKVSKDRPNVRAATFSELIREDYPFRIGGIHFFCDPTDGEWYAEHNGDLHQLGASAVMCGSPIAEGCIA